MDLGRFTIKSKDFLNLSINDGKLKTYIDDASRAVMDELIIICNAIQL